MFSSNPLTRMVLASPFLGLAAIANAQEIGKVGASNPAAQGTPPGKPQRTLDLGAQVIFNERVATSGTGSLQLAFLDKSTLGLGPNSEVILDEYVYNPKAQNGKMVLDLGKGVLRFVGGDISHAGNVEIRTPVATIGVRGGAGGVSYVNKVLTVRPLFGVWSVQPRSGPPQVIRRSGFKVTVGADGTSSGIERTDAEDFASLTSLVGSRPYQTGGAPVLPTDKKVVTSYNNPLTRTNPAQIASLSGTSSQKAGTSTGRSSPAIATSPAILQVLQTAQTVNANKAAAVSGADTSFLIAEATAAVKATEELLAQAQVAANAAAANATQAANLAAASNTDPASTRARSAALQAASNAQVAANLAATNLAAAQAAYNSAVALLSSLQATSNLASAQTIFAQFASSLGQAATLLSSSFTQSATAATNTQNAQLAYTASNVAPARPFALTMSAGAGSAIPYLTGSFVSSGNGAAATISPVLGYRQTGTVAADGLSTVPGRTRALQVALSINGQGAGQSSNLMVATGAFQTPVGNTGNVLDFVGGFFASGRTSASGGPSNAEGPIVSQDSTMIVNGEQIPTGYNVSATGTAGGTLPSSTLASQGGFNLGSGNYIDYDYNQVASATATPTGLGTTRTARTITGYVAGVLTSVLAQPVPNSNNRYSFVSGTEQTYQIASTAGADGLSISFDPTSLTARGTINISSQTAGTRLVSATYQLGSTPNGAGRRSAFIDDQTWAMRQASGNLSTAITLTEPAGTNYFDANEHALVPWSVIAASNPNAAAQYFPGTNICSCSYTQWGFWSMGTGRLTQGGAYREYDYGNLVPWVAGELSSPTQIPNVGAATYTGHAIANINNNGSQYVAGGNFSHTVNFATQTGTGSISNLDGRNYALSTALTGGNLVKFSGTVTGVQSAGTVAGSFYGPGTPPAEMGGQFGIRNTAGSLYWASGIFAGKR